MTGVLVAGGFPGQRMQVLPTPVITRALDRSPTQALTVTDAGHFPRALWHGIDRPDGTDEAVVIICTAGRGWYADLSTPGGETGGAQVIGPGRVLFVPCGLPHRYWTDQRDPWSIWWLHLAGTAVAGWLGRFGASDRAAITAVHDQHRASALVDELITTLSGDVNDAAVVIAASQAWSLLGMLLAEHLRGPIGTEPVRVVQQRLARDLTRTPAVPELADEVGLSASHLSALFRRATGGGVLAYLTGLRMTRARELLAVTSDPISTVAAQVGYPDPYYFSRQFRRVHGCSPTAYRSQLLAGVIASPDPVA